MFQPQTTAPRFAFRAVKFNRPWMSYRRHESRQLHDQTCRDLGFCREFLDMMAGVEASMWRDLVWDYKRFFGHSTSKR